MKRKIAYQPLYFGIMLAVCQSVYADTQNVDTPVTHLEEEVVKVKRTHSKTPHKDLTTAQKITQQLIMDNKDLVRYNPEVSVAEVGRYGARGFAIQGVDGNRVAMVVDGVRIPDIEVNEFYLPYGKVHNGRFMSDVELSQGISINKGADSLESGNGAVGGAVVYKSKEPDDLIFSDKNFGGYFKTGYTSKNQEKMAAVGLSGRGEKWSGLVNYVYREGHHLQNYAMKKFDKKYFDPSFDIPDATLNKAIPWEKNELGVAGVYPDQAHYEQHGTLLKAYFQPNEEHKIGVHGSFQYLLNRSLLTTKKLFSNHNRQSFDETQRTAYGINYEYFPTDSNWLSKLNLDYTNQQVITAADTISYAQNTFQPNVSEYRPTYFDTQQLDLQTRFLPIQSEKFPWLGEHRLKLNAQLANNKFDPYAFHVATAKGHSFPGLTGTLSISTVTNSFMVGLQNNIRFGDKLDMNLGVRYDHFNRNVMDFHPGEIETICGMLLTHTNVTGRTDRSCEKSKEMLLTTHKYKLGNLPPVVQKYVKDELKHDIKKDKVTWQAGLNFKPVDWLSIGYQAGTGFLMPTNNQSYANFTLFNVVQLPNVHLKPETSFNQQVSIQTDFGNNKLKLTGYKNDYQDFMDMFDYGCGRNICFQYRNHDKAKSEGIALSGEHQFTSKHPSIGTIKLNGQIAYQKGTMTHQNKEIDLLAIQPLNGLLSITHKPTNENFEWTLMARYLGAKKAKDAKRLDSGGTVKPIIMKYGEKGENRYLTDFVQSAWVFDLYGQLKMSDKLSLQAGVYNLFDKKYIPWESVQSMAKLSINEMVEKYGIERYTAPGRNFAISMNYEF